MKDQEKWDARYRETARQPLRAPDPFVQASLARLGDGEGARAVDLAGGRGRHVGLLREHGWSVELIDVSSVGLAAAREIWGVPLRTRILDMVGAEGARRALEEIEVADLVLVVDFLERDLWQVLGQLVRPGGHVLVRTFTTERRGTRPPDRFCLEPGEMARGLPGLETVDVIESGGRAGLLGHVPVG